jgi:3-oxoacyl-[acyl-carrier protein] reductase
MNSLSGKKALVTGGASGIGKAIVSELANLGADVLIHYFSSKIEAAKLAGAIGSRKGNALICQADLTDEEDVRRLAGFVEKSWGSLDVLVNNAGDLVARVPFEKITSDLYGKVMAVNLESMFYCTQALLPLLKKSGEASIVNISSVAGRTGGGSGAIVYGMAKSAMLSFTRKLASDLAPSGIRVNAVTPGFIEGSRFHEKHTPEEQQRTIIAGIPLGRAGTCEDVARAVAFLACEYNGFITGATLDINGGVYMS